MRPIINFGKWLWRAWPFFAFLLIVLVHVAAYSNFPGSASQINKIVGTALQIAGGLIVLYSINDNLGLFRNQHLGSLVLSWVRSFPLFRKPIILSASNAIQTSTGTSGRISVRRVTNTLEEKVAELERQLDEFRSQVKDDMQATNMRISQFHHEFSTALTANKVSLEKISKRLEQSAIGGFKLQTFGVILAIYGTFTSLYA